MRSHVSLLILQVAQTKMAQQLVESDKRRSDEKCSKCNLVADKNNNVNLYGRRCQNESCNKWFHKAQQCCGPLQGKRPAVWMCASCVELRGSPKKKNSKGSGSGGARAASNPTATAGTIIALVFKFVAFLVLPGATLWCTYQPQRKWDASRCPAV